MFSWITIIAKRSTLARTRNEAEGFESKFWSGGTLHELYSSLGNDVDEGLPSIFKAGPVGDTLRDLIYDRDHASHS